MKTFGSLVRGALFGGLFGLAAIAGGGALAAAAEGSECAQCDATAFRPDALVLELPAFEAPETLPMLEGFEGASTDLADVQVERGAGISATALGTALDDEVAAIERSFSQSFATRPTLYAFATAETFAGALRTSFGYDAAGSAVVAANHGGVFDAERSVILLNWSRLAPGEAVNVLRHELAHAMIHQLTGVAADLPAWLDEGLAVSLQPDAGPSARDRSIARSLVANGQVRLAALASNRDWVARNAQMNGLAYAVAAEALDELAATLGHDRIVSTLASAGRTGSVHAAFAEIGVSLRAFETGFDVASVKLTATTSRDASGLVRWQLGGFAPGQTVNITIDGDRYHLAYTVAADARGGYWGTFGATARAGEYQFTAGAAGQSVTTTLTLR